MSLQVQRISNNENYRNRQKSALGGAQAYSCVTMTARNARTKHVDASCDGKFSFWQAAKNFGKGLVSPITSMFSSKKNFLIGAGMIVGGAVLVAATGGAAAPLLVGLGVAMGTAQAAKGVYRIVKAKNGDDVEKAFYDIGGATGTIGLSMLGAKSSLKQAGIESEGLNVLSATGKCLKSTKSMATESFGVLRSGYYRTNLSNAYKAYTLPKSLKTYSRELYLKGKESFDFSFNAFKKTLPGKFQAVLKGRNKCEISIYEKMVKEMTTEIDNKIADIKKDAEYTPETKQQKIAKCLEDRKRIATDGDFAKSKVEDLLGARITLKRGSHADVQEFITSLVESSKKGDLKILEIENYRGKNAKFSGENEYYFSEAQVQELKDASGGKAKAKVRFAEKKSGYTAVNMKIQPKGGEVIEVQVRFEDVDRIADLEHPPYDLGQGKDIAKGNNKIGVIFSAIERAIKKLNPEQKALYNKYFYDHYINAQAKELGKPSVEPVLPEGIDPILSVESIDNLSNKVHFIPQGAVKSRSLFSSQMPLTAGILSLLKEENKKD